MPKRIFKPVLPLALAGVLSMGGIPARAGSGHDQHDQKGHGGHENHGGHDDHHGGGLYVKKSVQETAGFKRVKVRQREIKSYIEATGLIELNHDASAHIIPRIPGKIFKVLGHLGDTVKKGQTLVVLDSLEMSKAKSEFLVKKSALGLAESNFNREKKLYENKTRTLEALKKELGAQATMEALKEAELGDDKGRILTAMTDLELAQDVFKREKNLLESGIGAKKEFIRAEKDLTNAKINLESVLEDIKIDAYRTFVKFRTEFLTAKSQFEEAKERLYLYGLTDARIEKINSVSGIDRALFPLVAPFDGTIVEKHVTLGEITGEESLYTLSDLSKLWVIADIYEDDLEAVKVGQRVLVSVGAYKTRLFTGTLVYISDLMDKQSRTVKARVVVDNEQRLLKPGMFAQVKIEAKAAASSLAVPLSAIQSKDKEKLVFVALGSERFEKKAVKLGEKDAEYVAVLSGLREGETVITEGSFLLKSELMKEAVKSSHGHSH